MLKKQYEYLTCVNCPDKEATYDSPNYWCDQCWDEWWLEDISGDEKESEHIYIFVCRAYIDLGSNISDEDVKNYVLKNSNNKFDETSIIKEIENYRQSEKS